MINLKDVEKLISQQKFDEAIQLCNKALGLLPHNNEPQKQWETDLIYKLNFHTGVAYQNSQRYQQAIEAYQKALKYQPQDICIHLNIAICYYGLNQLQNSLQFVDSGLQIHDDNYQIREQLQILKYSIFKNNKQFQECQELLKTLFENNQLTQESLLNEYLEYLYNAKDYNQLLLVLDAKAKLFPKSIQQCMKNKLIVYLQSQDYNRALLKTEEYIQKYPNDSSVLTVKIQSLLMLGRRPEAKQFYQESLVKFPNERVLLNTKIA
ncbi:tetratricopeptide repeat protein (macronuclear) [Tetrahymena thermophila SB210]|uniref:Tetratricopeptide repeat protein n=1 Tax=Tetrahymena thermophila (strain SB210) TaxID=312017 RepID=I7M7V1_TETTS|nr:tetratricopeptide repeat protein [Tetrahymena thermophila SB210]EAR96057.2 tetratricopeptide repeat protein [Tetrahymena thermophila SB210]|eukprot:XP_001016302.2 tetratricopeptide repeat protein [Tetrahymena thermophila SB210]